MSQPSTVGAAVLITDNGSRAWGSGGEFYLKQDTYHLTAIYFRGNINYDFYGTGTASGSAGLKLPLKQTGEMFLGDFLYRIGWKFSAGPRLLTGNSIITLRSSSDNGLPPPPDVGFHTRLTALGVRINRDTRRQQVLSNRGDTFRLYIDVLLRRAWQ